MKHYITERGFQLFKFKDRNGELCRIQESSLATEDCIWLGFEKINPVIMVSDAKKLGIETDEEAGYIKYEIPKEVQLNGRMHLNQEQAKELVEKLNRFIESGNLKFTMKDYFK